MNEENTNETGPRAFNHLVGALADGDAHEELTSALHKLTAAMRNEAHARNGKVKGKLTLELAFTVEPNDVVSIEYAVRSKAPDPRRPSTILWATRQNGLSPQNPKQMGFGEIKEVQATHKTRTAPTPTQTTKEA